MPCCDPVGVRDDSIQSSTEPPSCDLAALPGSRAPVLYFSDGLIGVRHREHIAGEARDAEYLLSVALSGFRTCEEITEDLVKLKAPMDGPTSVASSGAECFGGVVSMYLSEKHAFVTGTTDVGS